MTLIPQLTITPTQTVTRHPLNFYESPSWFTTELLRHVPLSGVIGEPCVGHQAIASLLQAWTYTEKIWTNDIDPNKQAHFHLDATLSQSWDSFPECDWICTNPPYSEFAAPIIKNAYQKARVGVAAFLLTSFLVTVTISLPGRHVYAFKTPGQVSVKNYF
ncbi:hypothetical protein [Nostoc sp. WHI]|uniref:hypothetical protein n=1 Tax=Nostoc sp. WHI TaxID=2650611 RepID=UPI001E4EC548|nr:hypothetical protein [Nostoc sp. WHI]